ncbi:MAG: GNAT family N-acetyltransferase [Ardenticatenaceae bacterium]|nr:GNAT family N-acetyltransferase [Ardenticatenaceae bacterium]
MTNNQIISLREITDKTVRTILRLDVGEDQKNWVAPNAVSISEAYFEPKAWFRAIYAGEEPVGFLMTYENPDKPIYYLWRFMIDHRYQKLGYGGEALRQLIERVKMLPQADSLVLSVVPENQGAIRFYESFGFEATGEVEDGEHVYRLDF